MKEKKHFGRIEFIILVIFLAGSLLSYCVYAERYRDTFIDGTYINGFDAGGMKVSEVEDVIKKRVEDYDLTITFKDGQAEVLTKEDIGYSYVSDRAVSMLLREQNPYKWILGLFGNSNSYTVSETNTYDPDKLKDAILTLPEFSGKGIIKAQNACMKMGDKSQFVIVPEVEGNELRKDVVLEALKEAVSEGRRNLNISEIKDAYITPERRSDDASLVSQVKDLNSYLDITVMILDRTVLSEWLSVKEDDPAWYYIDKEAVRKQCYEFIRKMAQKYDKTYTSMTFRSTNRGQVTIPTEKHGYVIDEAGESDKLYGILLERKSEERAPLYKLHKKPYSDLRGGTYVEVDILNQHIYYYKNGLCALDAACVTGKQTDSSSRTPTGYFSVIEKDRDRTLRGEIDPSTGKPSYESYVNYWIRFYEGYGFHDASWRSDFGGDIYINSGSHGCVNLPLNAAKSLYSMVEYGTPVVLI